MTTRPRRSPLRERPLRNPGQAIQEEIERLLIDDMFRFGALIVATGLTVYEWANWFWRTPPNPWTVTVVAIPLVGYGIARLRTASVKLRNLRQGYDGERAVAEVLESLRAKGAVVLHDIPGEGFNIDHLVLSPRGIYSIET